MNSRQAIGAEAKLLRPQDVQRHLGISRRTYQRYLSEGILTASCRTLHGHRRFTEEDVERARGAESTRAAS